MYRVKYFDYNFQYVIRGIFLLSLGAEENINAELLTAQHADISQDIP